MKYFLFLLFLLPITAFSQTNIPVTDINKAVYKVFTLDKEPDFLAADGNIAWVIDNNNNRIQKISTGSDEPLIIDTIQGACAAPVIAFNAVWVVSCKEKSVYKIDKNTGKIIAKISTGVADEYGEMSLAAGDGSVWLLTDSSGVLSRINPTTNTVQAKINVAPHSYCASFGYGSVWVTNTGTNTVQKINTKTNAVVATIAVGKKPRFLSAGEAGVWTLNQGDGTVSRIDPATNKVVATIAVKAPGGGGDIAAGAGKVWVASTNVKRPLQTINLATNTVTNIYLQVADNGKIRVDGAVRVSGKYVWNSNLRSKKVWVFKY